MPNVNIKRVTREKFEQEIEDSQVLGWSLKSQNENIAMLTKSGGYGSFGWHALIFILTVWWSLGFWNVVYAVYAYFHGASELQIKIENTINQIQQGV